MSQQLANFASTTLNGAINNSVTSITVTDGSVFPATGDFYVIVDNEIMKVTARSSNTLTVVRAQEGTSAASHSDLSLIKLTLTAATFDDYFGERISMGSYASFPSSPRTGQMYYANDLDAGWRYNGSTWDMIHPLYVPYARQIDVSSWTQFNAGSSVWTHQARTLNAQNTTGSGGDNIRGWYKTVPTAPFTATLIVRNPPTNQQFTMVGLFLGDTTKLKCWAIMGNGTIGQGLSHDTYNTTTSYNGTGAREAAYQSDYTWLRVTDNNTNVTFYTSVDGENWTPTHTSARTGFFTATVIGLFVNRTETTYPDVMQNQFLAYWE